MDSVELFLTAEEEIEVVKAIQKAEFNTSGEIRVHIEKSADFATLDRAKTVFYELNMDKTQHKNGVLLYIATDSRQFAIIGDEGINNIVPNNFWEEETQMITSLFAEKKHCKALVNGIERIGKKLKTFFPHQADDTNELSDSISKG